ncbi:ankyrin repeat-containing domain protein [Flammula alnicola]|nr:ankyrin repeat-containing domain protein [Flammula alnicola]
MAIAQEKDVIDKKKREKELREIADWLTPINFRSIHNDTFLKHTPGTGVRFLKSKEFQRWLSTSGEMLWVTGMPGAGKTILSSIVVDHLQTLHSSSHDVAVIISYCHYTNQYSVEDLLSSFIKQLLEHHDAVFSDVQSFYDAHKRDATRPTRRELRELFQKLCSHLKAVHISIDALDEVSDDTKYDILDAVASFSRANVFLASRPLDAFEHLLPEARCLRLDPRDDIKLFIRKKLEETPRLRGILKGNEGLIPEILEKLRTKSEGMFLAVSLQIELLKGANTLKKLREILESLPSGVHAMYSSTVARIESQSGDDSSLAMRALLWLTYAVRPLRVIELQHALAISNDAGIFDLDDVTEKSLLVSVCCGLVVVDQETDIIRLAHYTAHDFFKALTIGVFARPHTFITESCMVYLSEIKKFGQISYRHLQWHVPYGSSNRLLHYVYDYWGTHARSCHGENGLPTLLSKFLFRCGPYPWKDADINLDRFQVPHIAICYGLSELLPQILESHDKPTTEGRLPLQLCVMYGQDMIMQALLECHPEALNVKDGEGNTALILACDKGNESAVQLLVSYDDIDLNSEGRFGKTPLILAAKNGNFAITQLLVSHHRLNPNQREGQFAHTALILASGEGHVEIVRLLLSRNDIDVNSQGWTNISALSQAASAGHAAIVELLLARDDINANARDFLGDTPLLSAGGDVATVKVLLSSRKVDVNHHGLSQGTALIRASSNGHKHIVELLLAQDDIDINRGDYANCTALLRALESKEFPIVKLLLSSPRINVNAQATDGKTALLEVASQSHCPATIFEMLISRKELDVNQQDKLGRTALMVASQSWELKEQRVKLLLLRLLLSRSDIDMNKQDQDGNTALIHASSSGNVEVVKLLLSRDDVDVNMRNEDGDTALVKAAISNHHEAIIELLISCDKLDADERGSFRETAVSQAEPRFMLRPNY